MASEGQANRRRSPRPAMILLALAVLAGCGRGATVVSNSGTAPTDLEQIQTALATTIAEAHLTVEGSGDGTADAFCLDDSRRSSASAASYVVVLNGEDPVVVARRIRDVWRRHREDWFGGGLTLDDSMVDRPGNARVHLYRDGWGLEAFVPDNPGLGAYYLHGGSPCR